MKEFIKDRWFLLLVLVAFVAFKVPHLSYPYYWDESWPYAPAVHAMYQNGPSLSPAVMVPDLSRGHPLLFHFLAACWMKLFGASLVSTHSFSLFIALCCLVALHELVLRIYGRMGASLAVLFLASREAFIVQSGSLLPEVMVALFTLCALWAYAQRRHFWAAISLTALFFTKETGMVAGVVLGLDAAWLLFAARQPLRERLLSIASVAVAFVVTGLFFLYQHHLRGWYVFPYHVAEVNLDWNMLWYKFRTAPLFNVFAMYTVYIVYLLLAVLAIVAAVKSRRWGMLLVPLLVLTIYYMVDDKRCGRILPRDVFAPLFVVVWFGATAVLARLFPPGAARRLFGLSMSVIFCYLLFCSVNFYTFRYAIAAVAVSAIVLGALFQLFQAAVSLRWLHPLCLAVVLGVGIYAYAVSENNGDTGRLSFAAMEVQQSAVDYLEQHDAYGKGIAVKSYVEVQHLLDPATGFLRGSRRFERVKWNIDDFTRYVIFNNIDADYRYQQIKENPAFALVHRFEKSGIWTEIYRRN